MQVDISPDEQRILVDLLDSRLRDLHPTIRRSRVSSVTDELKHDLEDVRQLLKKIQAISDAD